MADKLDCVVYTSDMFDKVKDFDYGGEPFEKELADWMRDEAAMMLERGTRIWLYMNQANQVVGYGSLGQTNWKYPPGCPRTKMVIIPAVAIRKCFQGEPRGDPKDERYASQIMCHLLDEAANWPGEPAGVCLYVHPDNKRAIGLYNRFGFVPFSNKYRNESLGVDYLSYVLPLREPTGGLPKP